MLGLAAFNIFTPAWRNIVTGKLVNAPHYRSLFRPEPVRPGTAPASTDAPSVR
jgi:hypothetical protein